MPLALLLFPPAGTPLDRAIDLAEGSPVAPTHAAVLCGDYYIEAVYPAVRMTPAEQCPANVVRAPLTLSDQQQAFLVAYLRARVNTVRYSLRVLAVDAARAALHVQLPAPDDGVDCSGIIAEGLVAAGAVTTMPTDPALVTPADLAQWVAAGQPRDLGALLAGTGQP